MFSSLRAKIIFFMTLVMVATAGGVIYFTNRDVGQAMSQAGEASARNILRLVELNIQGGYRKLLFDRVDALTKRKEDLKTQAGLARSVLEQFDALASKGIISADYGREVILNWLRSASSKGNEELLVFNEEGLIIAHPDPAIQSTSIASLRDMKGRLISQEMSASVLLPSGDFAVFDWKRPGEDVATKRLGYFIPVKSWKWTVAAVVDISDIEAETQRKLEEIIKVLKKSFEKIQVGKTGSVFMFNGKKDMLIPPHTDPGLNYESITNTWSGNLLLDDLMNAAKSDDNALTFAIADDGGSRTMASYIHYFRALDWYIAVTLPVREIELPAKAVVTRQIYIISLIFFGSLVVAYLLVTRISRPLNDLASYARDLPATDFTTDEEESTPIDALSAKFKDEVGRLAESFVFMKAELRKNVQELMETTAAKERIESELQVASSIQMGILPKIFPPFPERSEFEIYAILEPAKEVGGDFYDFFFVDDDHLCFAVGDVSDKGVPAALFMAVAKTLIKMKATVGLTSDQVLIRVNQDLSIDNPTLMFVTLFLGILNVRTGELEYSIGGHDPPFIIRASGEVEPLELTNGIMLGVEEDLIYESRQVNLQKGETLFVYTDGVTEANNPEDQLFSPQRLQQALVRYKDNAVTELVHSMRTEIELFSEGAPQFDDITMLALKFYG
jgi:sigma-B regulation protein RsbU (phosphoserine phosphatase)